MEWSKEVKVQEALRYFLSLHEAYAVIDLINDDRMTKEDVKDYLRWVSKRNKSEEDTGIDIWYEEKGY